MVMTPTRAPTGAGQTPRSLSLTLYPTIMNEERTLFTTTEAARQLGISPSTVKDAIATGTMDYVPIHARLNMVTRAAIEAYRRDHLGQQGRPARKKATKKASAPPEERDQAAHDAIDEGHTQTESPRE
jgi:excisionase family DNA binding protein